jgi:predicted transcriptional regulator
MSTTTHKVVKVGVMSLERFKQRTMAIAKGEYKPIKSEPKIWFQSMKSLAHVLSEENQSLLKLITEIQPPSIKALAEVTGRKANNLLRTLRTMENYGFVKLMEGNSVGGGRLPLIPKVIYQEAAIQVNLV